MALFKSSNPVMQEKTFQGTVLEGISTGEEMSMKGTMNKFGVLILLMMGSTVFSWSQFYKGGDKSSMMYIEVYGRLALAFVMNYK